MEPHERKVHTLVQHLQLIRNEKVFIGKLKRRRENGLFGPFVIWNYTIL